MWKFVTRGIRETLEKRACRTNVCAQTTPDNNTKFEVKTSLVCSQKFAVPSFSACNNGFCGSNTSKGAKDKDDDQKWYTKYGWTEAVGWSSILAVGWVVCQSLCLRRRLFGKDQNESCPFKIPQARVSYLLTEILNQHSHKILPVTNCVGNVNRNNNEEELNKEETAARTTKTFGPITVEEALNEAADEFSNTHKLIVGEFELQFGVKALEEKRYTDAVKHFSVGAKLSSPGSTFNLGLCYELGLGTLADQTKAARYYRRAAEQGHRDAMYNLGVFHAQGKGGLKVDLDTARSYFTEAANLGQIQAQQALDLENTRTELKEIDNTLSLPKEHEVEVGNSQTEGTISKLVTKLKGYNNTCSIIGNVPSALKSQRIEFPKDSTEVFLNYLGIFEQNSISLSSNLDECKVQS